MTLEHCARILTKNEIRECDKEELRTKELTHEKVMKETETDSYELERDMFYEVLESLKKKDKGMFKLLNKSGEKYKEAV